MFSSQFRILALAGALMVLGSCSPVPSPCATSDECAPGLSCQNGSCVHPLDCDGRESDALLCQQHNRSCGALEATDSCGASRSMSCGPCPTGLSCAQGACVDCSVPETSAQFCARLGKNCGLVTAPDRCGAERTVECGQCTGVQTCLEGVCGACVPESVEALCARHSKDCGTLTLTDNCGVLRDVTCGSCALPKLCGGGGVANVCGGCQPETDAEFCAAGGKNCGSFTGVDRCGNARTASCGSCSGREMCGGGGLANVCGCSPETNPQFCARLGASCGEKTAEDNCGVQRTVGCGSCGAGVCNGNVCSTCIPESNSSFCQRLGRNCDSVSGVDNCGTSRTANCGSCTGVNTCGGGGVLNLCGCTPESDATFCARNGAACGSVTGNDNCGVQRTRLCGTCQAPQSCGGGGTPKVCGCAPESKADFCARLGKNCDLVSAYDNCGANRTENCGSCSQLQTCGGGGVPQVCGCTPETDAALCARHAKTCGQPSLVDNCGNARQPLCGPACQQPTQLTFTNSFQTLPGTNIEFRCTGLISSQGRKCEASGPAVELKAGGQSHVLLYGCGGAQQCADVMTPAGASFKDTAPGAGPRLLCEAMGYFGLETASAKDSIPREVAGMLVQSSPSVYGVSIPTSGTMDAPWMVACTPGEAP